MMSLVAVICHCNDARDERSVAAICAALPEPKTGGNIALVGQLASGRETRDK